MINISLKIKCQTSTNIGVNPSEKPLIGPEFKHLLQHLIPFITGTQTIAMGQKEMMAIEYFDLALTMQINVEFLCQVVEGPDIMITPEKMNSYAGVSDFGQFTK